MLAIAKDGQHPFGRFLAMVTVAHSNQPSSTDTDTPEFSPWFQELVLSRAVTGGNQSLSGDVDFVVDNMGLHPVVYLEAEGHGAYAVPGRDVDDYSPMFNAHSITDWRGANWDGIVGPPASGSPTQTENTGSWDDGVIFHYEGVADIPGNTDNGNLPHHFQVVGYQLISIQELWGRRRDFEWSPDEHMFDDCNAFAGGHANPPWQWGNGYFLDPASLFELKFDNLGGVLWPQAEGYISRSYEAVAGC